MIGRLADIEAVILAGGYGTRLRSVVNDRPKVLADVNGRPFVTYVMDLLKRHGITTITMCTGYMGEKVQETIGRTYGDIDIKYSYELFALGTGGAVRLALNTANTDPLLIVYGDAIMNTDLEAFWKAHRQRGNEGTVLLTKTEGQSRHTRMKVEGDNRIVEVKRDPLISQEGWINTGTSILSRKLIEDIPEDQVVMLETEMFPKWANQSLRAYKADGEFIDIGTPDSYEYSPEFVNKLAA